MLKCYKFMLVIFISLLTLPETAISSEHYVCADYVNIRNRSLSHSLALLDKGTKLKKVSRKTVGTSIKYSRYRVENTGMRGWIANSLICDKSPTLGFTEYDTADSQTDVSAHEREIIINLSKNMLFYYENGSIVRSWNIGSARAGKTTPTGQFNIWYKDVCPPYFGSLGNKNVPGCTAANPFGPKALWFSGFMYGLHGTNEPYLLSSRSTANSRRVSSGCIRNANENINWLFGKVKIGDPITITW